MATRRQKTATHRNIQRARDLLHARARDEALRLVEEVTPAEARLGYRLALPARRKEPFTDAEHVRNAIALIGSVSELSDADRDRAWKRILAAARKYGVAVPVRDWRDLANRSSAGSHEGCRNDRRRGSRYGAAS